MDTRKEMDMENILRSAVTKRKNELIHRLIKSGIYKKGDQHLFELTLTELEHVYRSYHHNE